MKLLHIISLAILITGCTYQAPTPAPTNELPAANSNVQQAPVKNTTANVNTSTRIDLSNRGLTKLTMNFSENSSVQELNVSYNKLTGALPAEIRFLTKLKVLDASHNQFTGVPAEIGQLQDLGTLDYSYNQLTGLPYELANLKKLKVLNLAGNAYSELDLGIIRKGLPADVQIITQ